MESATFYAGLPVLGNFSIVTQPENFAPLPADWHVATCDVKNSTLAVQAGNYKHVNTVGAAAVTAVLNAAGSVEIPFIFEGDGSAFCVPPSLLEDTKAALMKTQEMAAKSFGLELRVAAVPLEKVRQAGLDIRVARVRVSENYIQAVFAGGGMAWADRAMKDAATASQYAVDPKITAPRGSLEGLECRWQDIPSRHGETVSLMVRATAKDPAAAAALYRALIAKVQDSYGADDACHPITLPGLAPALGAKRLYNEVGVRAAEQSVLGKWVYLMRTRGFVVLGWFLMRFGLKTERTDWSTYKETMVRNTDVRKFNDIYRQILSGTESQREALTGWLEVRYRKGELCYGMHVTDRAHMTCLVFSYSGRHLHFIDGADGGLFLAAKEFKERAAKLAQ
ncbi:MAG TPA: DUF3095 domain-containing protein [Burkholderiales bacterium]|jgi:hypothetical protein|nr:DUF3095 domain-containing protein [Burkholderiales bacterium]